MSALHAEPLTAAWIDELVAATSEREPISSLNGIVGLGIGSKVNVTNASAVFSIVEGRATGVSEETPEVAIPFSAKQLDEWMSGDLVLTEAYMKGDLKPVGASGPLFAALELLDWVVQPDR